VGGKKKVWKKLSKDLGKKNPPENQMRTWRSKQVGCVWRRLGGEITKRAGGEMKGKNSGKRGETKRGWTRAYSEKKTLRRRKPKNLQKRKVNKSSKGPSPRRGIRR